MDFKVGDRVIAMRGYGYFIKGCIYTVTLVRPNYFRNDLTVLQLDNKGCADPDWFRRADLTDLEKVIYRLP